MSLRRPVIWGLLLALLPLTPASTATVYLQRNGLICDDERAVCLRGSLSYDRNPRLLRLRGRVQIATGPGILQIVLAGTNRRGDRHYTPMEIPLRGHYSEIVDYKMIPDHPDVDEWRIDAVRFLPQDDAA